MQVRSRDSIIDGWDYVCMHACMYACMYHIHGVVSLMDGIKYTDSITFYQVHTFYHILSHARYSTIDGWDSTTDALCLCIHL
jgi:hypothetical protein